MAKGRRWIQTVIKYLGVLRSLAYLGALISLAPLAEALLKAKTKASRKGTGKKRTKKQ